MREYAVVLLAAALVTFLATPVVRVAAVRFRVMAAVRERDVHVIPTPRGGGVAMYLGVAAGVLVASRLPSLQRSFEFSTQTIAVLAAGGLICLLGVLDDRFGLDALTKLTGQIAAAGVMVLLGVQLAFLFVPIADIGTLSLGSDVGVPATILMTVFTVNPLNFIDGLDGLAAGVSAIAALAFFAYSYHLGLVGYGDVASAPALITAVLAGACLGFLPHNFSPARIFMGDSGSMLVGLMLSAAAVTATGGVDPQSFDSAATLLPLALPLLVPIAILFIPFVDLLMAVVRRTRKGQSPFSPDKMHLHHRLLSIGHSHRRAVLVMYFWSALLSFGAVALSIVGGRAELLVVIAVLLVVGVVVVLSPRARRAGGAPPRCGARGPGGRRARREPQSWLLSVSAAGPSTPRPVPYGHHHHRPVAADPARSRGPREQGEWPDDHPRREAATQRRPVGPVLPPCGRAGRRRCHRRGRPPHRDPRGLAGRGGRAGRRPGRHRVLLRLGRRRGMGGTDRRHVHPPGGAGDVPGQGAGALRRAERAPGGRLAGPADPGVDGDRRRTAVERRPVAVGVDPAAVLRRAARPACSRRGPVRGPGQVAESRLIGS